MNPANALLPFLDPSTLIEWFGPFAVVGICAIVFVETGLLIGFLLPGDTLLLLTGVLTNSNNADSPLHISWPIWLVCLVIGISAFLGDQLGYWIGLRGGPKVFGKEDSVFFSRDNVRRTNQFFTKYGGRAVVLARFVPVLRTFAPVAAGVGQMNYRRFAGYNALGALLWGVGVTFAGWVAGFIPWVSNLVVEYIGYVLLGVVVVVALPMLFEIARNIIRLRKKRAALARGEEVADDGVDAQNLWRAESDNTSEKSSH